MLHVTLPFPSYPSLVLFHSLGLSYTSVIFICDKQCQKLLLSFAVLGQHINSSRMGLNAREGDWLIYFSVYGSLENR